MGERTESGSQASRLAWRLPERQVSVREADPPAQVAGLAVDGQVQLPGSPLQTVGRAERGEPRRLAGVGFEDPV